MRSQLFERVLRTCEIPHPAMKRLASKNYEYVVLGAEADKELPDVHGIPPGYLEYGRGGVRPDNTLFMEGGPQGSRSGHPSSITNGFYFGTKELRNGRGVVYVRGRAGVNEAALVRMEIPIVDWISRNFQRISSVRESIDSRKGETMFDEYQQTAWDCLCGLSGEEVAKALTDFHGTSLLSQEFVEFLAEEGYAVDYDNPYDDYDDDDDFDLDDESEDEDEYDPMTDPYNADAYSAGLSAEEILQNKRTSHDDGDDDLDELFESILDE